MPQAHGLKVRDTVLLTGWLFADLLLGLMVIFFAAIPAAPPRRVELTVKQDHLNAKQCKGELGNLSCDVQLMETTTSQEGLKWDAFSDMSTDVIFKAPNHSLSPGQSVTISITNIPCENGAFIFRGSGVDNAIAAPVLIQWSCTALPERLEHTYCRLVFDDQDPNRFSNDLQFAKSVLEPRINALMFLQKRQVGIAIAYGGVDNANSIDDQNRGVGIASNIYLVLQDLGSRGSVFKKTSYYEPLFTGKRPYTSRNGVIDLYLVIRPDNPNDTCSPTIPLQI